MSRKLVKKLVRITFLADGVVLISIFEVGADIQVNILTDYNCHVEYNIAMKKVIGVFAHPDDESMGPGGTIAKFAQEAEVYLICATDGNAKNEPNPEELGQIRQKELLTSAEILGVKKVNFLGFADGGLNNNEYHNLANKIEEKVREYEPDILLTFDINGLTGHLDHVAVALATSFVYQKVDFVKTLLYYCETKEMVESSSSDYFIYTPPGYNLSDIDLKVDISEFLNQKKQAIAAHKSQQDDVSKVLSLIDKEHRVTEYFRKLEK